MAIIVEEEKSSIGLVRVAGWAVFVIVVCVATYYIFFAAPETVIIPPPADFQAISSVAQFTLQPTDVLQNPTFQTLKAPSFPLPTPTGPAALGRPNPFVLP